MGDHSQESLLVSPVTTTPISIFPSQTHPHGGASFPITAVAIIGIIAAAFLLVTYYIFLIKCCPNSNTIHLLRWYPATGTQRTNDPLSIYSPATENRRGLDESAIRSIPIFHYKIANGDDEGREKDKECSVCLNEFQEAEELRVIPNCGHSFHIVCIDVWLQNNANCPICRNLISALPKFSSHNHHQDPISLNSSDHFTGRDEDYVVIEIYEHNVGNFNSPAISISPSSESKFSRKSSKILSHNYVTSLGDECIEMRQSGEEFAVEPIRRSFSMPEVSV